MLLNNFRDVLRRSAFSAHQCMFFFLFPLLLHILSAPDPALVRRFRELSELQRKLEFRTQARERMTDWGPRKVCTLFESGTIVHCGALLLLELFAKPEHVGSGGRL